MFTKEDNLRLTQTGKGTPMGELLRRYWHPIAAVTEFEDKSTKPVRLMGEDLVLYKDRSGTWGLLALHCPHRRADLSYGFVEECGLRCSYHGWAFDEKGNCISQPFEDTVNSSTRFRDAIKQQAYPVEERAGMLFAYLGPDPAPYCPTWEPFTWDNGFRQIVLARKSGESGRANGDARFVAAHQREPARKHHSEEDKDTDDDQNDLEDGVARSGRRRRRAHGAAAQGRQAFGT